MDQNKNIIFIAALPAETPNLINFHYSGVGKINATMKVLELIRNYKPYKIVNYGTAGSISKELSGLIKCTSFVQRDMDARGLMDFKLGETPFDQISTISFDFSFTSILSSSLTKKLGILTFFPLTLIWP